MIFYNLLGMMISHIDTHPLPRSGSKKSITHLNQNVKRQYQSDTGPRCPMNSIT